MTQRGRGEAQVEARAVATLSLDLDNLWSYLKTRGDGSWRSFPSFLDVVVPRVLRLLDSRSQPITWFMVGQDAALPENRAVLAAIDTAGHEIGNHSFLHEPWMHRYSPDEVEEEVRRAEEAIESATGQVPRGFRGPGYSLSEDVLRCLERRGYRYDASTLPTFVGPLARKLYSRRTDLTPRERAERDALFGGFREGTRPLKPYCWRLERADLVELPVTTMPVIRTPIHMSYLVFLAQRAPSLARGYLATALRACRYAGVAPSLLLHSHDFIGADDVPAMSFFPGFRMPGEAKVGLVTDCIDLLLRDFNVMTLSAYADTLGSLPIVEPKFRSRDSRTSSASKAWIDWRDT